MYAVTWIGAFVWRQSPFIHADSYVNNGKELNFVNLNQSFTVSKQKNEFSWDIRLTFFIYAIFTRVSLTMCFFFHIENVMKFIPLNALRAQITVKWEWKKNATLCTLFIYWKRNKNVMCPDQMFVESIHLERSVSTICAVKMKWEKCVAKMNHLKNVWCILHVICNIKPSNIWHGYGCAINRNCKCLHWIKWE